MKKLKSLSVLLAAILLLIGCEKEKPPLDEEYFSVNHWPVVKTEAASQLSGSTAHLNGNVNAYGLSTTVTFEYGTTTSYGSSVTAIQNPVTGNGITGVSADISGLFQDTTYHFRVKAENSLWKNFYGRDMEFTTPSPKVETLEATNITVTTATLNGTVCTYGVSTPINFEYGTTTSYGSMVPAYQSPVTGNGITYVSAEISGLTPCTIYHFRIKAENSLGKNIYGNDVVFPIHSPEVGTLEVTNITEYAVTLNGTVTGFYATVTIEYGTTTSYGSTVTPDQSRVTGNSITNLSAVISGLTPCTTYHFRVKAENSCGIGYGSDKTFICADPIWTTYTTTDGLVSNEVSAIAIDALGNKWFGTSESVSKFDGTTWTNYTPPDLIIPRYVSSIAIDKDGNIWSAWFVGDWGGAAPRGAGVKKFDGTTWTTYRGGYGLVSDYVYAIAIDAQGNKWFGAEGGVSKFDGTNWTTYTTADGLVDNYVWAIAIDAQGNKWFGTGSGVSKFDGTAWTTYNTSNSGLVSNWVNAIAIDAEGNKWFGTYGGVSKFDGTAWTNNTPTPGRGRDSFYVYAIAIDGSNNIWISGSYIQADAGRKDDEYHDWHGVSKFDGTTWTTYTTADGLASTHVEAIAIDAQGNKWFGTDKGISKLSDVCK